jgi:hypothetical protein
MLLLLSLANMLPHGLSFGCLRTGASGMPTIQIETEQLLNAALQLPREELERFIARLNSLRVQVSAPVLSEKETELFRKINCGLPPADAARMKALIAKRQDETITDEELQELIGLTDESERLNVERMQALAELAQLRGVSLTEIMTQLGIKRAIA